MCGRASRALVSDWLVQVLVLEPRHGPSPNPGVGSDIATNMFPSTSVRGGSAGRGGTATQSVHRRLPSLPREPFLWKKMLKKSSVERGAEDGSLHAAQGDGKGGTRCPQRPCLSEVGKAGPVCSPTLPATPPGSPRCLCFSWTTSIRVETRCCSLRARCSNP